jgi:hypothetical protein
LKVFATIFLAFSIFIQTFSSFIIRVDFYLNRAYIAKNLCVNKDKPLMHCNGNCYLSKKLKEQEKQDQQTPVSKNERFDIIPFFVSKPINIESTFFEIKPFFFIKNDNSICSIPRSIFHPPSA